MILTPSLTVSATPYTTLSPPPFVKDNSFITGLPTCQLSGTEGPIGVLQDTSHFYVGDVCNNTLYRFPLTGGHTWDVHLQNFLAGGLATGAGHYYGVDLRSTSAAVKEFDPNTLVAGATLMTDTKPLRDLVYDPQTGDLYVTGDAGVYRIQNPSTTPTVTLVVTAPNTPPYGSGFDGIAISPDDSKIWVAANFTSTVYAFSTTDYSTVYTFTPCQHPDGMAIAPPNTEVGGLNVSNDAFVVCNSGDIHMLDPTDSSNDKTVASGGERGDFATVGTDGYMYATSGDSVEQLVPGFFGRNANAYADAYTASATVSVPGGPVESVPPVADAPSGGGTVTNSVEDLVLPDSLGEVAVSDNTAGVPEPFSGVASARANITSVTLNLPAVPSLGVPACQITADSLTTVVTGSTTSGSDVLQLDPSSDVANLSICGVLQTTSPPTQRVFTLPGGIGTLTVFDQVHPSGFNYFEATALHLQMTVDGATVDVRVGDAAVGLY